MHHPTDRIAYTATFVTLVMRHRLEREIAHWVHSEGSIRRSIAPRADTLPRSYILLCFEHLAMFRVFGIRSQVIQGLTFHTRLSEFSTVIARLFQPSWRDTMLEIRRQEHKGNHIIDSREQ